MHKSQTAIDAAREKLLLIFFSYFWRSHRELFFLWLGSARFNQTRFTQRLKLSLILSSLGLF